MVQGEEHDRTGCVGRRCRLCAVSGTPHRDGSECEAERIAWYAREAKRKARLEEQEARQAIIRIAGLLEEQSKESRPVLSFWRVVLAIVIALILAPVISSIIRDVLTAVLGLVHR
jgi:hypothetical protein